MHSALQDLARGRKENGSTVCPLKRFEKCILLEQSLLKEQPEGVCLSQTLELINKKAMKMLSVALGNVTQYILFIYFSCTKQQTPIYQVKKECCSNSPDAFASARPALLSHFPMSLADYPFTVWLNFAFILWTRYLFYCFIKECFFTTLLKYINKCYI